MNEMNAKDYLSHVNVATQLISLQPSNAIESNHSNQYLRSHMTTSINSIAIFELFSIQFIQIWDIITECIFESNESIEQSDKKIMRSY